MLNVAFSHKFPLKSTTHSPNKNHCHATLLTWQTPLIMILGLICMLAKLTNSIYGKDLLEAILPRQNVELGFGKTCIKSGGKEEGVGRDGEGNLTQTIPFLPNPPHKDSTESLHGFTGFPRLHVFHNTINFVKPWIPRSPSVPLSMEYMRCMDSMIYLDAVESIESTESMQFMDSMDSMEFHVFQEIHRFHEIHNPGSLCNPCMP